VRILERIYSQYESLSKVTPFESTSTLCEEERPSSREQLINVIMATWDMLMMTMVSFVVDSMPRRIQKLCDKEGKRVSD
jgi:hypothetical protein